MKEAFKLGFGVTTGMYCAIMVIGIVAHFSETNKKPKEDLKEEES